MADARSNKVVFTSHCILAQTVRAEGCAKSPGVIREVLEILMDHDINVIQMPCPETMSQVGGLGRDPHGKKWYEERGFRSTCTEIANGQAKYAKVLKDGGKEIIGVIGVEFSPACATKYLNRGPMTIKDEGIYIEELKLAFKTQGIIVPFVGICQRWHKKLKETVEFLCEEWE